MPAAQGSSRPERVTGAGRAAGPERERLLDVLRPVVEQAGYDLEDISVTAAGRRSLVRVVVDKDGGIDLDAVADVSRVVSETMDSADDGFAGPYVLEVTSPGVDRPLTEPRHWRRAVGRLVKVTVGDETVTDRLVEVTGTGAQLGSRHVEWGELGNGLVQVEFSRVDAAAPASDGGEG